MWFSVHVLLKDAVCDRQPAGTVCCAPGNDQIGSGTRPGTRSPGGATFGKLVPALPSPSSSLPSLA